MPPSWHACLAADTRRWTLCPPPLL